MGRFRSALAATFAFALLLTFNNCGEQLDSQELMNEENEQASSAAPQIPELKLASSSYQVQNGQSAQLLPEGGVPPYTFAITPASRGNIDSAHIFRASQLGVASVRVTDSEGRFREISMIVEAPPPPPPAGCAAPFGPALPHLGSIQAYNVAVGTCVKETRVCVNGNLSGSHVHQTCRAPKSCKTPWNQTIAHGASVRAYKNHLGWSSCSYQDRVCNDGVLSGSYTYPTCNEYRGGSD